MKKSYSMNRFILVLIIPYLFFSCTDSTQEKNEVAKLPFFDEATFTPHWWSNNEVPDDFHQIPKFSLTDQEGEIISEQDLDGKITIVDFFFTTCPGICSDITNNMGIVQEKFIDNDNVIILSHSVTPEQDNIDVLAGYAESRNVNSKRWHLLTGERSMIYDLGRHQYFVEEDLGLEKDDDEFIHTENFVMLDRNRRIRGIYNGLSKTSIKRMIRDMNILLNE